MPKNLPQELRGTNYQFIKELEKRISNEETRNKIIFLTSLIGSYEARANYKAIQSDPARTIRDFRIGRITSKIFEAGYIAHVGQDMIQLLGEYTPKTLLEKLYSIIPTLKDINIPKEGLYGYFKHFDSKYNITKIGSRFYEKLKANREYFREEIKKKKIEKTGLRERILLQEESILSGILVDEIEKK